MAGGQLLNWINHEHEAQVIYTLTTNQSFGGSSFEHLKQMLKLIDKKIFTLIHK